MSEMIDRVARAIFNVMPEGGRTMLPFGVHPEHDRCMKQAAAAIAAMREPTDEMLHAYDGMSGSYTGFWASDSKEIAEGYRTMIDKALKE